MQIRLSLISLVLLFFTFSCKEEKKEKKEEVVKEVPQDQLQLKVAQLEDSACAAWKFMMEADDQKIAFTKRLLDEISYTPKYDVVKHDKLMKKCLALKSKRFGREDITSEKIDRYDLATDSLLKEVKALVLSTPNVENYPLCSELLNDISALDNDVVMHRVKYDNWAIQYNSLIEKHGEEIKASGNSAGDLKPKGTFQLDDE